MDKEGFRKVPLHIMCFVFGEVWLIERADIVSIDLWGTNLSINQHSSCL